MNRVHLKYANEYHIAQYNCVLFSLTSVIVNGSPRIWIMVSSFRVKVLSLQQMISFHAHSGQSNTMKSSVRV